MPLYAIFSLSTREMLRETYDDYQRAMQAASKLPDTQIVVIPGAEVRSLPSRLHPLILSTSKKVEPSRVRTALEHSTAREALCEALQCNVRLGYGP